MITGAGMAEGENPKRLWSKSRHPIAALRVSTSRVRLNTLTHLNICIGEQQSQNFPSILKSAFVQLMKRLKNAQAALEAYCTRNRRWTIGWRTVMKCASTARKPPLFMKKGVKASVCLHYGEKSGLSNEN